MGVVGMYQRGAVAKAALDWLDCFDAGNKQRHEHDVQPD
jgi:hypothetical protein